MELELSATAKVENETMFIAELNYGAVFGVRNLPEEQLQPLLLIECPRLMFPYARRIFADAIRAMTLRDALGILHGGDDAATRYFQNATAQPLRERFAPVVESAMARVGVYDAYRQLVAHYDAIPFAVKPRAPRLEDTVVDGALAGLWQTLAEEEARIRRDPAARTTALSTTTVASTTPGAPRRPTSRPRRPSTWTAAG